MRTPEWRDLLTYALGIGAAWLIAGRIGAGLIAALFCLARIYVAHRARRAHA